MNYINEIENDMDAKGFVTDLEIVTGYLFFKVNGGDWSASLTKAGKIKKGSYRRG